MKYIIEIEVSIDSRRPYSDKIAKALEDIQEQFFSCLIPLGFEGRSRGVNLYHPDEECEMRGIDFAARTFRVGIVADELRQVPFLIQLVQALCGLFDQPDGFSVSSRLFSFRQS